MSLLVSRKFDSYVLYPRTKKQKLSPLPPCKETGSKEVQEQNLKLPLIPCYQKVLPQIPR